MVSLACGGVRHATRMAIRSANHAHGVLRRAGVTHPREPKYAGAQATLRLFPIPCATCITIQEAPLNDQVQASCSQDPNSLCRCAGARCGTAPRRVRGRFRKRELDGFHHGHERQRSAKRLDGAVDSSVTRHPGDKHRHEPVFHAEQARARRCKRPSSRSARQVRRLSASERHRSSATKQFGQGPNLQHQGPEAERSKAHGRRGEVPDRGSCRQTHRRGFAAGGEIEAIESRGAATRHTH